MRIFLLSMLYVCFSPMTMLSGQVKYEKEYRIKAKVVPKPALDFVSEIAFNRRIRWYQEESLSGTSIEAKTKYHQHKYSLEFDEQGRLQDVEIQIKATALGNALAEKIQTQLDQGFSRHRWVKIQRQWSGPSEAVLASVQTEARQAGVVEKYEIVVKGKSEEGVHWYEYTFDGEGREESRKKIVLRNTDNLEY